MTVERAELERIVREVVAELLARRQEAQRPRRVLALFSGASTGYLVGMEAIHGLAAAGHKVTAVLSPAASHVIGVDKVEAAGAHFVVKPGSWVCAPDVINRSDLILVPTVTMNLAARLAAGLMDSLLSTLILGGLLAGKPVLAVRDGADPYGNGGLVFGETHATAPALRRQLSRNLETLATFGITLVGEEEFLPAMWRLLEGSPAVSANGAGPIPQAAAPAPAASPAPQANGRVHFITETDLLTMQPGSVVRLAPGCRLTPLAQDTARRLNLQLSYE